MSIIKNIEKDINKLIKESGYEIENFRLQPSNRKDLGDYQINDAMNLAKTYHENPRIIAEKIKENLEKDPRFTNVNIAGPGFINISFSDEFLIDCLNQMNHDVRNNIDMQEKKKIILDYGGANVAKALHVGHLRSANIGESLKRLARILGNEVLSDAHLGDYGRPLGLVILEIKNMYPELPFFDSNYTGDFSEVVLPITNENLEKIYPQASQRSKEDENYLEEAREITAKIQAHERGYYDLWKKIVDISKAEIKKVYQELNVDFDLWLGESDAVEYFDELLKIFEDKHILVESNGAKIVEVANEDDKAPMPPLLFVKSNGSISYETTDLATILQRQKDYRPDEIWYCVDGRQSLHFEQVFRAARKANLVDENVKLEFIGFGTMNGNDGKPFKTRDGGVMTLKNLISLVNQETLKRINPETVSLEEKDSVAKKVAIAALKYADLLPYRGTDYVFSPEKFADLEGKTGPYILYSTIRMKSLLEKGKKEQQETYSKIKDTVDRDILITLLKLSTVLTKSYEAKSLNDITEYIFELTSQYNKFYAENKILSEQDPNLKESWLVLTSTVYKVNLLLLDTLGLKVPEKM